MRTDINPGLPHCSLSVAIRYHRTIHFIGEKTISRLGLMIIRHGLWNGIERFVSQMREQSFEPILSRASGNGVAPATWAAHNGEGRDVGILPNLRGTPFPASHRMARPCQKARQSRPKPAVIRRCRPPTHPVSVESQFISSPAGTSRLEACATHCAIRSLRPLVHSCVGGVQDLCVGGVFEKLDQGHTTSVKVKTAVSSASTFTVCVSACLFAHRSRMVPLWAPMTTLTL